MGESKLKNDTEIAHFKRDYDFKKAGYDVEVNTAKASADLAYTLQAALMTQQIKEQETQVKVIERRQEIELQEQEIQRKERELDSKMRKPAEAEKYRLETIAEAQRQKTVLDAQPFAIEAKAKAEAEQMAKKADAWNEYGKAALMDMMLKMMPKVASEIAEPLSKAKKIPMISDGSGDIGAAKLTGEILAIMGSIPETVTKMTGVNIAKQLSERRN